MCKSLHRLCFSIVWMWEMFDLSDLFIYFWPSYSKQHSHASFSLHSSSFPKMTMYPKVSKRAHTRSESSTSYRSPVWEVNMKTQLPQSESSLLHRLQKEVKKGVIVRLVIMPYLPWWLLNACFCLFWWNVLTATLFGWEHWGSRLFGGAGVCDVLYVTMSQASSEPAGHDQMDQSNPVLRDPYITCCYSAAQTPPVTFTLFLFKEIWAWKKLHIHLLLILSRLEISLTAEDLSFKPFLPKVEEVDLKTRL